jgi:hypothetical protein
VAAGKRRREIARVAERTVIFRPDNSREILAH